MFESWFKKKKKSEFKLSEWRGSRIYEKRNEQGKILISIPANAPAYISYLNNKRFLNREDGPAFIFRDGTFLHWFKNHSPFRESGPNFIDVTKIRVLYKYDQIDNFKLLNKTVDLMQLSKVPDLDGYVLADALQESGYDDDNVLFYLRGYADKKIKFLEVDNSDETLYYTVNGINKNIKKVIERIHKRIISDIQKKILENQPC